MSTAAPSSTLECNGWRIHLGELDTGIGEPAKLLTSAVMAINAPAAPHRRSRHATTYRIQGSPQVNFREMFVKILDAPTGTAWVKRLIRGSTAAHVLRITRALTSAGVATAPLLFWGHEIIGGREFLLTRRAEGEGIFNAIDALKTGPPVHKWALMRALGREVARLHLSGFVHGDLTPYNIFVIRDEPPRFVFIDHERTRRNFAVGRKRRQLRNLVQLGRFAVPGLSRTDRARVLDAYAGAFGLRKPRRLRRRVANMLLKRQSRDRRSVHRSAGRASVRTSVV
ncbi:MAG: lipopolysaccharide kinase InaA family protein [Candidatus Binataceae bacterium]